MKKLLITLISTICTAALIPLNVGATDTSDCAPSVKLTYNGKCGDNLTWKNENGILTISGTGDMWANPAWNTPAFTKIVIEDGVTSIADSAFRNHTKITDISLPDTLTSIGYQAFENTAFTNDPSNYDEGVLYIDKYLITADDELLSGHYTVKDNTPFIPECAFKDCTKLTGITLPDSVTEIDYYAFEGCTSLTTVSIPNTVKSIGSHAFGDCSALSTIAFPDSLTVIGDSAFLSCTALTSVSIPPDMTVLNESVFRNCTALENVTLPDSITVIEEYAFKGCVSLKSIEIPGSVKTVEHRAFEECSALTEAILHDGVTEIGANLFYNCTALENIVLPDSLTEIGAGIAESTAYADNKDNWDKGVLYIGKHIIDAAPEDLNGECKIRDNTLGIARSAFSHCPSLTAITVPSSITRIPEHTFFYCTGLERVILPDTITLIGDSAFANCSSLSEINLNERLTQVGSRAFEMCGSLTDIYFTGTEEEWNKIYIHSGNDSLSTATLHFNHNAKLIDAVAVPYADSYTFTVEVENPTGYEILVISLYEGERLANLKTVPVTDESSNITINTADADGAKVFIINNINDIRPTGTVFEISL